MKTLVLVVFGLGLVSLSYVVADSDLLKENQTVAVESNEAELQTLAKSLGAIQQMQNPDQNGASARVSSAWYKGDDLDRSRAALKALIQQDEKDHSLSRTALLSGLENSNLDQIYLVLESIQDQEIQEEKVLDGVESLVRTPVKPVILGESHYTMTTAFEMELEILYKTKRL